MPAFWGYPHRLMITLTNESYWIPSQRRQSQSCKFKEFAKIAKHYTGHTFWSCLIRCANMKWIRQVLLKIQSGNDSGHRRTRWNQYIPLSTSLKRGYSLLASLHNPIVNPAMVSTVRFYDRNELYGSPDVRNCRMPNFLGWAFFVISIISIN